MTSATVQINCIRQIRGRVGVQETYETGSADLRRRAAQLRRLGFNVTTGALGLQVTPLGYLKLSLLLVHISDAELLPPVTVTGWAGV